MAGSVRHLSSRRCKSGLHVDLLDLVFVRNRLFSEDPGDAPADVNDDGTIDLEDLIEVRNNLGAECEE